MSRRTRDAFAGRLMFAATALPTIVLIAMAFVLFGRSGPILASQPLGDLLLGSAWRPIRGQFGFYPFIMGTLWVTLTAMAMAIPVCILCSIYLAEYAPARIRAAIKPLIDLLAGIPSVVYGLWGMLFVVPLVRNYISPLLGQSTTGFSVLAGGMVLAIMVFPIVISIAEEVFRAVPHDVREASFALGATKWQTVKHVVVRKALPGVAAAIVLGFSRAFGETMAVLMVVGNVVRAPSSLLDPAYPLPALIANNYGEMMSIPMYDSALMFAALILMAVVFAFSVIARAFLLRIERRSA
jgi:phosphate transport system permease protein